MRGPSVYPHFTVARVVTDSEGTCLIGTLSNLKCGRERWIKESWFGYLRIKSVLVKGRWHRNGELWGFRLSKQIDAEWLEKTSEFKVFDSYWGSFLCSCRSN